MENDIKNKAWFLSALKIFALHGELFIGVTYRLVGNGASTSKSKDVLVYNQYSYRAHCNAGARCNVGKGPNCR